MEKYTPAQLIRLLAAPAVTVLLGLILLFSPDTASALVGTLIAWACILSAVGLGAGVIFGAPGRKNSRILWAVICLFAGVWLLIKPLTVAKFLGRVLGIALMIRGAQSAADNIRYQNKKLIVSRGLILGAGTLVIGAVLALLPLASSRMFFNIIGIALICVGIAGGADKLRSRKLLDEGQDPNIIDVEKV